MYKFLFSLLLGTLVVLGCVVDPRLNHPKPEIQQRWLSPALLALQNQPQRLAAQLDSNTVGLKNGGGILPLNNLQPKTTVITLGGNSDAFVEGLKLFFQPSNSACYYDEEGVAFEEKKTVERCIVSVHAVNPTSTELSDCRLNLWLKFPRVRK